MNLDLQKTPYDDACALRIYARCDVDLQLWSNAEWLKEFEKNWPFR